MTKIIPSDRIVSYVTQPIANGGKAINADQNKPGDISGKTLFA